MTAATGISVVVPFFNSERHIQACVESLMKQEAVAGPHELIFINNRSTDASASIVGSYDGLTVLEEETPGAYAARNTGLNHARAPLIAFTDADCVVTPNWLRTIQDNMQHPATAMLVGRCGYPAHASITLRLLSTYENAKTEYVLNHCPPAQRFAYANNMAVRASVFDELGRFREWKRAADSELLHRLASRRPDLRVAYCRDMQITHLEFLSARARITRLALYARTNARIPTFRELGPTRRFGILRHLLRFR